jgi:hypothetical protein
VQAFRHWARGQSQAQQRIAVAAPPDKERILHEAVNALAKAVTDQNSERIICLVLRS